jgi:hypothetical protein
MYETGSATGVNDLVSKLQLFCETNGWTTDSSAVEGTGRRWHAHNGAVYVNFRSFVDEAPNSAISGVVTNCTSVGFNVGTGYSGASAWYNQAGVPQGTSSKYMTAGISRVTSSIPSYHFFAHNGGDNIMAVVEFASGYYQYFGFGTLDPKYGAITNGTYFFGSRPGVNDNAYGGNNVGHAGLGFFGNDFTASTPSAYINVTVDGESGWHHSLTHTLNRPTQRAILDTFQRFRSTLDIQPNTMNGLAVFTPVIASVFRADTNLISSTQRSPIGELPKVFFCKMLNLIPGQQVTLGTTDYRVFPFYKKTTTITGNDSVIPQNTTLNSTSHSSLFGFAVEE